MRAGYGKSELTPPMGVELAGYGYYLGRRAESVRDPLYARAHTGPCIKYHEGCGYVDEAYVSTVGSRICQAVDAACEDLSPVASLEYICAPFDGDHIYNRTIENGPVDRHVRGFLLARETRSPIAVVSAACHGVFRGRVTTVSADFAGEISRLLDAQGMQTLYLNGLCGDIDPTSQDDALLDSFAQLIAGRFNRPRSVLPQTLSAGTLPFSLQLLPVTRDDIHQAAVQAVRCAGGEDAPAARVALIWEREMLEKYERLNTQEEITAKYILLGGVPVIALPFEGFTQIGMDIRRLCGRQDALVLGCAEELLGYLPTRDDITLGTYAALESTFLYKRLPVVPGEAERLGEELGSALERILS